MAGIVEKIAKTAATLMQPTGSIVDGKAQYSGVSCMVFKMENQQTGFDEKGRVHYGTVFLMAPLASDPVLPAKLTISNKTYDISELKPYRNMQGVLLGYRLTSATVGGA